MPASALTRKTQAMGFSIPRPGERAGPVFCRLGPRLCRERSRGPPSLGSRGPNAVPREACFRDIRLLPRASPTPIPLPRQPRSTSPSQLVQPLKQAQPSFPEGWWVTRRVLGIRACPPQPVGARAPRWSSISRSLRTAVPSCLLTAGCVCSPSRVSLCTRTAPGACVTPTQGAST